MFLAWASKYKKNEACLMLRHAHQLRPGLFSFESSYHKTKESQSEMRYALASKGTEVRLTKRALVGSCYLPYIERCYTCLKYFASHMFRVCMLLIHDTSLLPTAALHVARRHDDSVGSILRMNLLRRLPWWPSGKGDRLNSSRRGLQPALATPLFPGGVIPVT